MAEQLQALDFQIIERASEQFSNIREIAVHMEIDGKVERFMVEIYKHFAPIQIRSCVEELIEKLDLVRLRTKNNIGAMMMPYTIFLIIKHFTTLKLPNSLPEQLKAIEHMINTGTMFQIFLSMDEDEVSKVREEVAFALENLNSNLAEVEAFRNEIREKLVDKSLLD